MDVDAVIAGLSEGCRQAMREGRARWATRWLLVWAGLAKMEGGYTETGLAVRARLEQADG